MDAKLLQFIEKYVDTFVAWDLIVFYDQNPGVIATVPELVACLGRKLEDVAEGVQTLKRKGILKESAESSFVFDPPKEIRKEIKKFVEVLEDRNVRLQILTSLLKKGAR